MQLPQGTLFMAVLLTVATPVFSQRMPLPPEQWLASGTWCARMDSKPDCNPARITVSGDEVTILLAYRADGDTLTFNGTFSGGTMTGSAVSKNSGSVGRFTGSFGRSGNAVVSLPGYAGGIRFQLERLG
jgi:hypothetical protein